MMWNEATTSAVTPRQQVPMTGLQAKRKREDEEDVLQDLPAAKFRGRGWSEPRLGRVDACDPWCPEDDSPPESEEEDDEDEDEEVRVGKTPSAIYRTNSYPCYTMDAKQYFSGEACSEHGPNPNYGVNYRPAATAEPYCPPPRFARTTTPQQQYWPSPQYCYPSDSPTPPPPNNQTIRCAENGKSYLELGASPTITSNSNNNSVKLSRTANYRQQRLAVLNISMCKLSRFRQFPDPSLHRSVLICNTLRRIEREMEHDSQLFCSEPPPTSSTPGPINYPTPPSYPATPPPAELPHYEHSLRDLASPAPRATPFPSPAHPGSEDSASSINWGSVLSLSSQSDLDPLNNNSGGGTASLLDELDSEVPSWRLTPLSAEEVLKSVPPEPRTVVGEELVDSLMHVLVGT